LREGRDFEAPGELQRADQNETVTNIFAGRAVIAAAERIERVLNTVDVIEQFADYRAPSGGVGKNIIGGEFEAI